MAYETLLVERRGPVGWLVFDRPDAGNAMDATMFRELEAAWRELDDDPAVRVIVNTGNGRAFQTGVDVVQLGRDKQALREQSRRTRDAELRLTASAALNNIHWENLKAQAARLLPLPQAQNAQPLPPVSELVRLKGDPLKGAAVFRR